MLASLRRHPILDLDGTVLTVYGHQRMAEVSYNPRKRGRPSYHAIFCFEGHTRDCLEGALHPGKTHVLKVIRPIIEQALRRLPKGKPFRVRADGAFYDGLFRAWLEERRARYAIAARLTAPIKHRLSGLRYRQVRRGIWTAEFRYCPQGWQRPARFIVIRRPVPEEPSAQLHLFKMEGYTYQVLVTNLHWTPLTVWRFYNDRSRAETHYPGTQGRVRAQQDPHAGFRWHRGFLPTRVVGVRSAFVVQAIVRASEPATRHPAAVAAATLPCSRSSRPSSGQTDAPARACVSLPRSFPRHAAANSTRQTSALGRAKMSTLHAFLRLTIGPPGNNAIAGC